MALGAMRALEKAGRRPGRDVMVGGMGWTPQALQAIRDGKLVTSFGGYLLQILRELGIGSFLAVPLIARGQRLGVITLASGNSTVRPWAGGTRPVWRRW